MTLQKKKKGFRKIIVDGVVYNWKGPNIDIRLVSKPHGQALCIDYGYWCIWDYIHLKSEDHPPDFEPKTLTPKFVAESIKFGRQNGWDPENKFGKFKVYYQDQEFRLTKKDNL